MNKSKCLAWTDECHEDVHAESNDKNFMRMIDKGL